MSAPPMTTRRCCAPRACDKRFGAVVAASRHHDRRRRRRARQPDRQQRRRQDHLRQHDHRLPQARRRPHRASTAATSRRSRRARSPASASRARSRSRSSTATLTVLDNMLVAIACHDQRLSLLAAGAPAPRRSSAPSALLERFGLAEHRERRVAELPGGVRKLLDIAMALTGAAAAAAARRADQRRLGRGEVPDDGHDHDGARRTRR